MKLLSPIIVLIFLCGVVLSQNNLEKSIEPKVKIDFTSCEENDSALSILDQYTAQAELITIISHLGIDEKKKFGQRRLYNAKTFLTKGFDKFNRLPESVLIAEGEIKDEKGYLDFYVKGEVELRIFFRKNTDLIVPPCVKSIEEKSCETDFEKLFYPCKSKSKN